MKKLKEKIPVNKAGGGLVYNKKGEVLFIFRNGKWDLPKGGIEKGEEIEDTAIREVEEETGVSGLSITKKLQKTYHVFIRNGRYKLKITHWFEMKTDFEGTPMPQEDEGIEKVAWLNPEQVQEALKNSYENIKLLFETEKLLK
ncbi:8-oxo-dGTP pyrophosphatase MutT (NUDIX family) [Flavobacterium gossypii]|nr:8-oxo-dGTP pyrophosphatase MutT (NUDIX family) [Flavobacterium gossypii]